MFDKPLRYINHPYLDYIRTTPCVVCGQPAEPHHLVTRARGGSDLETVPLCRVHHSEIHTVGRKQLEKKYHINLWREAHKLLQSRFKVLES